jgi:hypothetical protein
VIVSWEFAIISLGSSKVVLGRSSPSSPLIHLILALVPSWCWQVRLWLLPVPTKAGFGRGFGSVKEVSIAGDKSCVPEVIQALVHVISNNHYPPHSPVHHIILGILITKKNTTTKHYNSPQYPTTVANSPHIEAVKTKQRENLIIFFLELPT